MVAAGFTVTALPLVTAPILWFTLPVPPEKTAVRVVLAPAEIVACAREKLVMLGTATMETVLLPVALPRVLLTTQVKVRLEPVPLLNVAAVVVAPAVTLLPLEMLHA